MEQRFTVQEMREAVYALTAIGREAQIEALGKMAGQEHVTAVVSVKDSATVASIPQLQADKAAVLRERLVDNVWAAAGERSGWSTHKRSSVTTYCWRMASASSVKELETRCRSGVTDLLDYVGNEYEEWFKDLCARREYGLLMGRRRDSGTKSPDGVPPVL